VRKGGERAGESEARKRTMLQKWRGWVRRFCKERALRVDRSEKPRNREDYLDQGTVKKYIRLNGRQASI